MRGSSRVAVVGIALLLVAAPAGGATRTAIAFTFGREGGNVIPFQVTIAATGAVHSTGYANVGDKKLTTAQVAALEQLARHVKFGSMRFVTQCPDTHIPPSSTLLTSTDIAARYVSTQGRIVAVHGDCIPRFTKLWNALRVAVRLKF